MIKLMKSKEKLTNLADNLLHLQNESDTTAKVKGCNKKSFIQQAGCE